MEKKKKFKGFSDLKALKLLKRDPNVPIFYHPGDCTCKKCRKKRGEK